MSNDLKDVLINLFTRVKFVQNQPLAALEESYEIQREIIGRILYFEKELQNNELQSNDLKRELSKRQTKDKARQIKEKREYLHELQETLKDIIYIFKSIGDALAFIYISTWDIKPMAFKESAGFISGKEGLLEELKVLEEIRDRNLFAILNDITNNLRYGDITVVTGENEIELLEVKSGRQQRKTHSKQMEKIQKIKTYLSTDTSQGLYIQGQTIFRLPIHAEVKHHRNEINNLIMQANEKEFAWSEVEKGLIYFVHAPGNSDELSEASSQAIKSILKSKVHSSRVVMLNTAKFSNRAYYPFILSLNDPNVIFDFYMGKIIINVIIDLLVLKEELAKYKLVASYLTKPVDHLEISSMDNKNGEQHIIAVVGYHILGRLFFDFLSLEWLIDETLCRVHTLELTQDSHQDEAK